MTTTELEGPCVAEIVAIYAGLVFDVRHCVAPLGLPGRASGRAEGLDRGW